VLGRKRPFQQGGKERDSGSGVGCAPHKGSRISAQEGEKKVPWRAIILTRKEEAGAPIRRDLEEGSRPRGGGAGAPF